MEIFGVEISTGQLVGGFLGSLAVGLLVRVYYKMKAKIKQAKK